MMPKYVLLDMDTQRDFLDAEGNHPVLNREALLPNLRKVFAMARAYHIPVVSAVDTHRTNEPFSDTPAHCVEGTCGQEKVKFSLLRNRAFVEANNTLDLPFNLWSQHRQIIMRRRTTDFLGNPKADRLITEIKPKMFIAFGVGLERSIRRLTLALLGRGRRVAFIPEACGHWNEGEADLAQRLLVAKGGVPIHFEQLNEILKKTTKKRIQRVFSKPKQNGKENTPRSLAG